VKQIAAYDQKSKKGTGLLQKNGNGNYFVTTVAPVKINIINDRDIPPDLVDHLVEFDIAESYLDEDGHLQGVEGNFFGAPTNQLTPAQQEIENAFAPTALPGPLDIPLDGGFDPPNLEPVPEEVPSAEEIPLEEPVTGPIVGPSTPPPIARRQKKARKIPGFVPKELTPVWEAAKRIATRNSSKEQSPRTAYVELLGKYVQLAENHA